MWSRHVRAATIEPGTVGQARERLAAMTLRRLGLAVPLAIVVAVLVHFATFGLQHAPTGDHAAALIASLGAALALAALCTVLLVALRKRSESRYNVGTFDRRISPIDLTLGGAIAYAAIERSEGHTPFGYGWSFVTLFAVVALVYGVSLVFERALRYCGEALAALADRIAPSYRPRFSYSPHAEPHLCSRSRSTHTCRGRAPPLYS